MFERFTKEARQAVISAQEEARRLHHDHIGTEHLLLGLLRQTGTLSAELLNRHGLDHERASQAVVRLLGPGEELDADALRAIGIDLDAVREKVEAAFGPGALERRPTEAGRRRGVGFIPWLKGGHLPLSDRAKKVLELSLREAIALDSMAIRDGHILLGLLRERTGMGARIIAEAGIDLASFHQEVRSRLR
ncbi:MAG: Clp protease [Thermobispora bispora]|nr:Clp protease [Thermobispora bispora]